MASPLVEGAGAGGAFAIALGNQNVIGLGATIAFVCLFILVLAGKLFIEDAK